MSTQSKALIIMGIDPGSKITGYGIISYKDQRYRAIDFGVIKPKGKNLSNKQLEIFSDLNILIETHKPSACAVESQYVHKNPKGAMTLGMIRGLAILVAAKNSVPIFQYAPSRVKASVCRHGHASKDHVKKMIALLLSLDESLLTEDSADALAIAICHAHMSMNSLEPAPRL